MRLPRTGSARLALLLGATFAKAISSPARGINVEGGSSIDYAAACPDYAVYATYLQYELSHTIIVVGLQLLIRF